MKCDNVKLKVVPYLFLSLPPLLFPLSFLYLHLIYKHKERDYSITGRVAYLIQIKEKNYKILLKGNDGHSC